MGNAALKQHVVRLLEKHAPLVVKELPETCCDVSPC